MDSEEKNIDNAEKGVKTSNKVASIFKGVGTVITNTARNIVQATKDELKKLHESKEFNKEFIKNTYEFSVDGTKESFRGFKALDENIIYFRIQDDEITRFVKSNSIITRTTDNLKLQVISVETKNVVNKSLDVNGVQIPLALFAIIVKLYDKEKITSVINNVTQNITITDSTIHGNIQQINDLTNKLNVFEKELRSFKPSIFKKDTYNEAIKIYGSVKESLINGQKDEPIIQKFIEMLGKISTVLLTTSMNIYK